MDVLMCVKHCVRPGVFVDVATVAADVGGSGAFAPPGRKLNMPPAVNSFIHSCVTVSGLSQTACSRGARGERGRGAPKYSNRKWEWKIGTF